MYDIPYFKEKKTFRILSAFSKNPIFGLKVNKKEEKIKRGEIALFFKKSGGQKNPWLKRNS